MYRVIIEPMRQGQGVRPAVQEEFKQIGAKLLNRFSRLTDKTMVATCYNKIKSVANISDDVVVRYEKCIPNSICKEHPDREDRMREVGQYRKGKLERLNEIVLGRGGARGF